MEIWVVACIVFIFGALLEYAFLLLQIKISIFKLPRIVKKRNKAGSKKKVFAARGEGENDEEDEKKEERNKAEKAAKLHALIRRADCLALILFPLCFSIFNLVYWIRYLK